MLTPHRFMDLNYSILNVTSLVIEFLNKKHSGSLDEILLFSQNEHSEINDQDVLLAVGFLYLLDKIEYCKDRDLVSILVAKND